MGADHPPLHKLLQPEWRALGSAQRRAVALWYAVLDPATEELFAFQVPRLLRSLRHTSEQHIEEANGRVRGHIHWPSTIRARAARGPAAYQVRLRYTVYDLPENQLLRWLSARLDKAMRQLPPALNGGFCGGESPEPVATRLRHVGAAVARLRQENRLGAVRVPEALEPIALQRALDSGIPEYQSLARHAERFDALSERQALDALFDVGSRLILYPGEARAASLPWSRVAALLTARSL